MQSLQAKASEWSGVSTEDAFGIDETNLFQKLGLQPFINLSTHFYTRYPPLQTHLVYYNMIKHYEFDA